MPDVDLSNVRYDEGRKFVQTLEVWVCHLDKLKMDLLFWFLVSNGDRFVF